MAQVISYRDAQLFKDLFKLFFSYCSNKYCIANAIYHYIVLNAFTNKFNPYAQNPRLGATICRLYLQILIPYGEPIIRSAAIDCSAISPNVSLKYILSAFEFATIDIMVFYFR